MRKNYNEIPLPELYRIHKYSGITFEINDGVMQKEKKERDIMKRIRMLYAVVIVLLSAALFFMAVRINASDHSEAIPEEYIRYCEEAGQAYNISPELLESIIETESDGNPNTIGAAGEIGLMQIYPKYHKDRMEELGIYDLYDPRGNIFVGADYIRELFEKYEDVGTVLMVYNGTKNAVDRGSVGDYTDYAISVIARSHELEKLHGK